MALKYILIFVFQLLINLKNEVECGSWTRSNLLAFERLSYNELASKCMGEKYAELLNGLLAMAIDDCYKNATLKWVLTDGSGESEEDSTDLEDLNILTIINSNAEDHEEEDTDGDDQNTNQGDYDYYGYRRGNRKNKKGSGNDRKKNRKNNNNNNKNYGNNDRRNNRKNKNKGKKDKNNNRRPNKNRGNDDSDYDDYDYGNRRYGKDIDGNEGKGKVNNNRNNNKDRSSKKDRGGRAYNIFDDSNSDKETGNKDEMNNQNTDTQDYDTKDNTNRYDAMSKGNNDGHSLNTGYGPPNVTGRGSGYDMSVNDGRTFKGDTDVNRNQGRRNNDYDDNNNKNNNYNNYNNKNNNNNNNNNNYDDNNNNKYDTTSFNDNNKNNNDNNNYKNNNNDNKNNNDNNDYNDRDNYNNDDNYDDDDDGEEDDSSDYDDNNNDDGNSDYDNFSNDENIDRIDNFDDTSLDGFDGVEESSYSRLKRDSSYRPDLTSISDLITREIGLDDKFGTFECVLKRRVELAESEDIKKWLSHSFKLDKEAWQDYMDSLEKCKEYVNCIVEIHPTSSVFPRRVRRAIEMGKCVQRQLRLNCIKNDIRNVMPDSSSVNGTLSDIFDDLVNKLLEIVAFNGDMESFDLLLI